MRARAPCFIIIVILVVVVGGRLVGGVGEVNALILYLGSKDNRRRGVKILVI